MHGIHSMLVTPFLSDGSVDLASLRQLVTFNARAGAHGVTILGVLGEVQKLTDHEREEIMETVATTLAGTQLSLTIGVSHGSARVAAHFARQAEQVGAAAIMLAPPPLLPAGPALLAFLREVAEATHLPLILQDYPPATGITLPLPFLYDIATSIPNVQAIKCEDPPTTVKMSALKRTLGDRLDLLGGLGGLYFLEELWCGAAGTLTGFAYPEILRAVFDAHERNDQDEACRIFAAALPLIRLEAQPGIGLGLRKVILQRRGVIAHATMRVPYTPISDTTKNELDLWLHALQKQGVLPVDTV